MPITLMLKPYHGETLTGSEHKYVPNEQFGEAAVPSLLVILVTHEIEDAVDLADRILYLRQGRGIGLKKRDLPNILRDIGNVSFYSRYFQF